MDLDYESQQIASIQKWKAGSPDAVSRVAERVLSPMVWAISHAIPEKAMLRALELGDNVGGFLSRFQTIKRQAGIAEYFQLFAKELQFCDGLARKEQTWAMGTAGVEGGVTGVFGLPGMIVDVPALVAFAMRSIHLMGLCYGFELQTKADRDLAFAILAASGASNLEEKRCALAALASLQENAASSNQEKTIHNAFSQQAVIFGAKSLGKRLGVNLTKRKMAQAIPFLGAGVGATVNAWYISDVCLAARRTFQERWLRRNGRWEKNTAVLQLADA